jgi:dipeptide/tripeptide permease
MAEPFPRQVAYIVTNEACERFSYYGMLSILSIYLAKEIRMGEVRGRRSSTCLRRQFTSCQFSAAGWRTICLGAIGRS